LTFAVIAPIEVTSTVIPEVTTGQ